MADDGHFRTPDQIVGREEIAAQRRDDAQHSEKGRTYLLAGQPDRVADTEPGRGPITHRGYPIERPGLIPDVRDGREAHVAGATTVLLPDQHQPLPIGIRQGFEEGRLDDAVDRCGAAHAETQRHQHQRRYRRPAGIEPKRKTQIRAESVQRKPRRRELGRFVAQRPQRPRHGPAIPPVVAVGRGPAFDHDPPGVRFGEIAEDRLAEGAGKGARHHPGQPAGRSVVGHDSSVARLPRPAESRRIAASDAASIFRPGGVN